MRATIVISSHNEGDCLWKTVRACKHTAGALDCEIVVADDASSDGSIETLQRRYRDVHVVAARERRGVSPTKDLGARSASGDVLIFLDGHCNPEPGAILRLIRDVEELAGNAVVFPRVPPLDTERWENSREMVGYGFRMQLSRFECEWVRMKDLERRGNKLVIPCFVGCCVAMSRELYERLGGWDTDMLQWGMEDVDFGLKVWLMGHEVLNDPFATIGHRFSGAFRYPVDQEHPLVNQLRTARKHFTDPLWEGWIRRFRARHRALWDRVWSLYQEREASVEQARRHLLSHRVRDEFWYAERFGLSWPRRPQPRRANTKLPSAAPRGGRRTRP